MEYVNVRIKKTTKKQLDKLKIHPREIYAELIERLIKEYQEGKP